LTAFSKFKSEKFVRKMRAGNGTLLWGSMLAMLLLLFYSMFVQHYLLSESRLRTQNAVDSLADSTAFYMAANGGDYKAATEKANEYRKLISDNTGVALHDLDIDKNDFQNNIITVKATASGTEGGRPFSITRTASTKYEQFNTYLSGSGTGSDVVNYALQFVGNPYVWGGTSLTHGCDCSGFTMQVFAHFGVSIPHFDASQRSCGRPVASMAEAQPGDLICYYGHVAIYMGNNKVVHAANASDGIKVSDTAYMPTIAAIRRLV
jgi:cell wall-associated NlpC family hydrolase